MGIISYFRNKAYISDCTSLFLNQGHYTQINFYDLETRLLSRGLNFPDIKTRHTGKHGKAISAKLPHVRKVSDGFIKFSDVLEGVQMLLKKVPYGLRKVSDGLGKV